MTPSATLGEADTRAKLIDPAIHGRGWTEDFIRREETAGGIEIIDGVAHVASKGRVDYTLRLRVTLHSQPVAVAYIEAKAEAESPGTGLEQAKGYAVASKRHNVPFVFSTNGHLFVEYDSFTQQTSAPKPLAQFPTPEELRMRYEAGKGFSLASDAAKPLLVPYPGGEATRRYYQDAAIRAVLEKVAGGEKKALLSLATGAGKTFIAVNLLRRISDAGQLRRALFVCDRDELRTQALTAFGNAFGGDVAEVYEEGGANHARNARVHIATYQTLDLASDEASASFLLRHYKEDDFSHIVIDECHRSAWGKWSIVLKHNPNAVQVGLTATPRELILSAKKQAEASADPAGALSLLSNDEGILADNVRYFGEPVYEYTLAQGIEDGYLAPPEIFTFDLFHDGRATPERASGVVREDVAAKPLYEVRTGRPVTVAELSERYAPSKLDERLFIPERVAAMSRHLFDQLCSHGGPEQKSIVFCASDPHAERVTAELGNLYADWCAANGHEPKAAYAFKCTAKSGGGDLVADLRASASSHFLACTVELLSTGIDVPCLRNVAFFQYIKSPIVFAQMLGRGTRLDPESEKWMFRVWDYTDATRLIGDEFKVKGRANAVCKPNSPPPRSAIVVEQVQIHIGSTGRWLTAVLGGRQQRITVEEYRERIAARLVTSAADLTAFRGLWVVPPERRGLLAEIVSGGLSPKALQMAEEATDYDLFDVLGEIGYGLARVSRANRAFSFSWKQKPWLEVMPSPVAATVKAMANQFGKGGTEALETPHIFKMPEVVKAGGLEALKLFGTPAELLQETKVRLFAA